ncbi:MAG: V8-like Glu-specific endopeptidase [Myxococcaceae bacterium]|nr:V8-like Glu-specific endopeptidase [Myxococcaceae bacterium]
MGQLMASFKTGLHRVWFSAAFAVAAACQDELPNADPPELYDIESASKAISEAAKAVVRIQHPAGSAGTGSFISADGLLLTNNHVLGGEACAREGCLVTLSFEHQLGSLSLPGRQFFAVPQHVDVGLDMAVLQVFIDPTQRERLSTPNFLAFETRDANELLDEHVTAIGHPLGSLKKWSSGFVIHADGDWFDTTIFVLPGGSGSPILTDEGRVVGLLHRGAEGFELLTPTSTQVSAIATATRGLQRGLEAPLPASVISVHDVLTPEAALAHSDAFLAASTWVVNLGGKSASLLGLHGDACDKNLARDDYTSLEELEAGVWPCFAALDFIECRTDVGEDAQPAPKGCPRDQRSAWLARLGAVSAKERKFNGSLDLSAISFSVEALADTQSDAERQGRDNILAALDEAKPTIDFEVASYLAAYGVASYGNLSVVDLFLNYDKVPFYERYAWQIAASALWLYAADLMSREDALHIAKHLYRDDKASVGTKLRIEEMLYNDGEL